MMQETINTPAAIQENEDGTVKHSIKVFDFQGKLLYTLDMPDNSIRMMRVCYYGDGEKIFVTNFTDKEIYVMELSDFEEGKWTVVNLK